MPQIRVTMVSSETIDLFRDSLYAKGRGDKTVKAYTSDMKMLLLDTEREQLSQKAFEPVALRWLTSNRKIVAPRTTARRLTSLRSFARWARWRTPDLEDYSAPDAGKTTPHPIPEGMDGVHRLVESARDHRQRALVVLCGMVGLRISEALAVRKSDFNWIDQTITIVGKGEKTATLPVSDVAWELLSTCIIQSFIEGRGTVVDMGDRFARQVVTDLGVKAGLQRRISSHDLRATFATAVYDKTKDIRVTQELLRHSSVETTQIYTAVELAKMRAAVDQATPDERNAS